MAAAVYPLAPRMAVVGAIRGRLRLIARAVLVIVGNFGRGALDDRLWAAAVIGIVLAMLARAVGAHAVPTLSIAMLIVFAILVRLVADVASLLDSQLRLRRRDDAVVMLGVLQIVLGHDPVARTLCIAGKGGVFLGDLLGGAADLHIGSVTLVAAREGIGSPAVIIIVIIIVVAPTHAPVLLSWPHTILFFENCPGIGERGSLTVRIALRCRL